MTRCVLRKTISSQVKFPVLVAKVPVVFLGQSSLCCWFHILILGWIKPSLSLAEKIIIGWLPPMILHEKHVFVAEVLVFIG